MRTLSEPGIMKETSLASQPTPVASPQASPRPNPRRSRLPGRFARLPELAGAGFLPIGLFARLPLAMLTVGTLTLVTAVSHSYAIGGMAAGAVGIGSALGAPVVGSLADRAGQRIVLLTAAVVNALAVAAVIAAAYWTPSYTSGLDALGVLVAAFIAGASHRKWGPWPAFAGWPSPRTTCGRGRAAAGA